MGAAGSWALGRLGLPAPRLPAQPRPAWLGVAALALAAVALGSVAWRRSRRRRRRRRQQVGTVAQLWIYPVKSCKGVPVSAAECTALGLRSGHLRDRYGGPGRGQRGTCRGRSGVGWNLSRKESNVCHLGFLGLLVDPSSGKIKFRSGPNLEKS